jgi:hypothetical protein
MDIKAVFLFVLLAFAGTANAAESAQEEYIEKWKKEAVRQMKMYSIPASITLAQGVLESGNGNSELAKKSNNHFGIKCHAGWEGGKTYHDDDEKGECFRVYDHPKDSYEDHSKFLLRDRYSVLFKLDLDDYKGWAKGLKKCGYATNPKYPELLITIIERHSLNDLDDLDYQFKEKSIASNETNKVEREVRNISGHSGRNIMTTVNGIQYILAQSDEDMNALSKELDMMPWQFRSYNEVGKNHKFKKGDIIYLQPKKVKANETWHVVQMGESLWSISQKHGVKTKALIKKNRLEQGDALRPGQKLSLKWKLTKEGKLPWHAKMVN